MNNIKGVMAVLAVLVVAMGLFAIAQEDAEATDIATESQAGTEDDLRQAITGAGDGVKTKITLTADISGSSSITIDSSKNIVLDLAGNDITFTSVGFNVYGYLTIMDSTASTGPEVSEDYKTVRYTSGIISSPEYPVFVYENGTAVLDSGHIESNYIGMYAEGSTDGTTTVKPTIVVNGGYVTSQEFSLSPQGSGATVRVNGGVMEARDNAVVAGYGSSNMGNTTIEMTGGTLIGHIKTSGYIACGMYIPQSGTVSITGGTIYADGGVGILARAGDISISGDVKIIATGNSDGWVGDRKFNISSAAVVVDQAANYSDASKGTFGTDITGGSFSSDVDDTITVVATEGADISALMSVQGGTFDKAPVEYLSSDTTFVQSDDGWVAKNVSEVFESGSGTEEQPYIIRTVDQLKAFRDSVNYGNDYAGKYIKVADDVTSLDISDGGKAWVPIGNGARVDTPDENTIAFAGNFDGNNVTISNLNSSGYSPGASSVKDSVEFVYGFFGFLSGNASISNLNIEATIDVTKTVDSETFGDSVGILAGYAVGDVTISKVTVSGSVAGEDGVGGIVGRAYVTSISISDCVNNADVSATAKAGGISGMIGGNRVQMTGGAKVENCTNNGDVTGQYAAGIVAFLQDYMVDKTYVPSSNQTYTNCDNTGAITSQATDGFAAGIIGRADHLLSLTVTGSDSTGNVTGVTRAAGIIASTSDVGTLRIESSTVGSASGTKVGISAENVAGGAVGVLSGGTATISGVSVVNASVASTSSAEWYESSGGLVGMTNGAQLTIAGGSVEFSEITAPSVAGGVVGWSYNGSVEISGVNVSGITVVATDDTASDMTDADSDNWTYTYNYVGGVVGRGSSSLDITCPETFRAITLRVANSHTTPSGELYYGDVRGAVVGMVDRAYADGATASITVVITGFKDDLGYELVAQILGENNSTYTFKDCTAKTAMEWMTRESQYNGQMDLVLENTSWPASSSTGERSQSAPMRTRT